MLADTSQGYPGAGAGPQNAAQWFPAPLHRARATAAALTLTFWPPPGPAQPGRGPSTAAQNVADISAQGGESGEVVTSQGGTSTSTSITPPAAAAEPHMCRPGQILIRLSPVLLLLPCARVLPPHPGREGGGWGSAVKAAAGPLVTRHPAEVTAGPAPAPAAAVWPQAVSVYISGEEEQVGVHSTAHHTLHYTCPCLSCLPPSGQWPQYPPCPPPDTVISTISMATVSGGHVGR